MTDFMRPRPVRILDALITYSDGREVCRQTRAGQREYFARLGQMMVRQEGLCAICGCWLGQDANFDHEKGRGYGGAHRDDRIVVPTADGVEVWQNAALCSECNTEKGSRRFHWVGRAYLPAAYQTRQEWLLGEPLAGVPA